MATKYVVDDDTVIGGGSNSALTAILVILGIIVILFVVYYLAAGRFPFVNRDTTIERSSNIIDRTIVPTPIEGGASASVGNGGDSTTTQ